MRKQKEMDLLTKYLKGEKLTLVEFNQVKGFLFEMEMEMEPQDFDHSDEY